MSLLIFLIAFIQFFLCQEKINTEGLLKSIASGLFEAASMMCVVLVIPKVLEKLCRVTLSILYQVDLAIALISYYIYGSVRVSDICVLVLGTNRKEAMEFFHDYLSQFHITQLLLVLILTLLVLNIFVFLCERYLFSRMSFKWISLLYICVLFAALFSPSIYVNCLPLQVKAVLNTRVDLTLYQKNSDLILPNESKQPDNVLLIVGESHNKYFSSLYGYEKCTNPLLEKRMNKGELVVFYDVVSPATTTIPSFKYMMSTFNNESTLPWYEEQTLSQIVSNSGYSTYWLSNQSKLGFWNNLMAKYASLFDVAYFTEDFFTDNRKANFDESLLYLLNRQISNDTIEKRFVLFHLMGSHPDFKKRYPKKYDIFKSVDYMGNATTAGIKSNYDNSLLYNDFVLNEIFTHYQNKDVVAIYLSDHGLDVFQSDTTYAGHAKNNKLSVENAIKIPFIIYMSPVFQKKHSDLAQRIRGSVYNSFMTDDIIYMIMDLMGVSFASDTTLVEKKSLLSKKYRPKRRTINGFEFGLNQ